MQYSVKFKPFPIITILMGALGFFLRKRLLSTADAQGLLPRAYIPYILLATLFVILFVLLVLCAANKHHVYRYSRIFPTSKLSALGCIAATFGIVYDTICNITLTNFLTLVLVPVGAVSAIAMLIMGYCRQSGEKPSYLCHTLLTVYLMLRTIVNCRAWCSEPQLSIFFYPFLALVFLLISAFFYAEIDSGRGNYRLFFVAQQLALFCCIVCISGEYAVFYCTMALWLATNFSMPRPKLNRNTLPSTEA